MSDEIKSKLERSARRIRWPLHWVAVAVSVAMAIIVARSLMRSDVVVVDHVGGDGYWIQSTFRTEHLTVDESAQIGSNFAAGLVPLELQTKTANTKPLDFSGSVTNTWDVSVATGSNTASATVSVFAATPTTTPSVSSSLTFKVVPGTGGAQGVWLRPNGTSFFDPDSFAGNAVDLLVIGATGGNMGAEFEVDDIGNSHSATRYGVGVLQSSHFDTTGGAIETFGINANCGNDRTSGGNSLTNTCGNFSATNGTVNNALTTDQGNVIMNRTNGTFTAHKAAIFDSTISVTGQADFLGSSLYTAGFGPTPGDTYITIGTINFAYNSNANDGGGVNFTGYHGATSQFRDFYVWDGKNSQIAKFTGADHSLLTQGAVTAGGLLTAPAYDCNSTTSPAALSAGANGDIAVATTTNCIYRLTADAANSTISGISVHSNGTMGELCNVAAAGTLTLLNDTSGTPADGFLLKGGIDRILVSNECVLISYVPTTARWMVIN